MDKIYITGVGGTGKVYLKLGAKSWTPNKTEGHAYRMNAQKALRNAIKRFKTVVRDIQIEISQEAS